MGDRPADDLSQDHGKQNKHNQQQRFKQLAFHNRLNSFSIGWVGTSARTGPGPADILQRASGRLRKPPDGLRSSFTVRSSRSRLRRAPFREARLPPRWAKRTPAAPQAGRRVRRARRIGLAAQVAQPHAQLAAVVAVNHADAVGKGDAVPDPQPAAGEKPAPHSRSTAARRRSPSGWRRDPPARWSAVPPYRRTGPYRPSRRSPFGERRFRPYFFILRTSCLISMGTSARFHNVNNLSTIPRRGRKVRAYSRRSASPSVENPVDFLTFHRVFHSESQNGEIHGGKPVHPVGHRQGNAVEHLCAARRALQREPDAPAVGQLRRGAAIPAAGRAVRRRAVAAEHQGQAAVGEQAARKTPADFPRLGEGQLKESSTSARPNARAHSSAAVFVRLRPNPPWVANPSERQRETAPMLCASAWATPHFLPAEAGPLPPPPGRTGRAGPPPRRGFRCTAEPQPFGRRG